MNDARLTRLPNGCDDLEVEATYMTLGHASLTLSEDQSMIAIDFASMDGPHKVLRLAFRAEMLETLADGLNQLVALLSTPEGRASAMQPPN